MPKSKDVFVGEFRYPVSGEYRVADTITVTETTHHTRRIDRRMTHAIGRAILGLSTSLPKDMMQSDGEAGQQSGEMDDESILQFLSFGIEDGEVYDQLCEAIKKALTKQPLLAVIAGTDTPLTDEVWDNIGIKGENKVLSVFCSFFFARLMPTDGTSANGSETSTTSSSLTRAASPGQTPPISHAAR